MKNTLITMLLCIVAFGCNKRTEPIDQETSVSRGQFTSDGQELPDPWYQMEYRLSDYVAMQPGRPIIISFGASWTMTSKLHWRRLFSHQVNTFMKDRGVLCLIADMNGGNQTARQDLTAFGYSAVPATFFYNPERGEWVPLPEIFDEQYLFKMIDSARK